MLTHLSSYNDYLDFVFSYFSFDSDKTLGSLNHKKYFNAFFKMFHLRVDDVIPLLSNLYSHTGRPAIFQVEILRSFILMSHFGFVSIKKWVKKLRSDPVLVILCGFYPLHIPSSSNHYDFISRVFSNFFHHNLFPPLKNSKPKVKHKLKKGEKLNNVNKFTTKYVVDFYLDGHHDNDRLELILQQLFDILAVDFSVQQGLTENPSSITASGDALLFTSFLIHMDTKSVNVTIATVIATDDILILKPISVGTAILKHFTLAIMNIISLTTINILVSIYLCFLL